MNTLQMKKYIGSNGCVVLLFSAMMLNHGCVVEKESPPNVVFILGDDVGYGDLDFYNPHSGFPAPNIRRLAEEGIRFTDAHANSICSPTRYTIMTGRYHWRSWLKWSVLLPFEPPLIEKDRPTLPGLLREHGYHTGCIGKWHLGWEWQGLDGRPLLLVNEDGTPGYTRLSYARRDTLLQMGPEVDYSAPIGEGPTTRGFDYYFGEGVINQAPFAWIQNDRFVEKPVMYWGGKSKQEETPDPNRWDWSQDPRPEGHASIPSWSPWEVMPEQSRQAVNFIRKQADEAHPFFLYLSLTAVHFPIVPAPEFQGKTSSPMGDFINQMDWVVGQVMNALEESGQRENTLIIFASDNGGAEYYGSSNYPWRAGKGSIYEGGHRVPIVFSWPGKLPVNKICTQLFSSTDYFRTIASLLGIPVPDDDAPDSFDFSGILQNPEDASPVRQTIVHRSGDKPVILDLFAVRKDNWKLIMNDKEGQIGTDPDKFELYNLDMDPAETRNLYLEIPEKAEELHQLMIRLKDNPERKVFEDTVSSAEN